MTAPDLTRGACVGHPTPDLWFSDRAADKEKARRICGTCEVQRECGTNAVLTREFAAIRAGLDGDTLGRVAAQARRPAEPAPPLLPPTPRETCGKPSGKRAHTRRGEAPCDACTAAAVTSRREARARARDAA